MAVLWIQKYTFTAALEHEWFDMNFFRYFLHGKQPYYFLTSAENREMWTVRRSDGNESFGNFSQCALRVVSNTAWFLRKTDNSKMNNKHVSSCSVVRKQQLHNSSVSLFVVPLLKFVVIFFTDLNRGLRLKTKTEKIVSISVAISST